MALLLCAPVAAWCQGEPQQPVKDWRDELVPVDGIAAKVNDEIVTGGEVFKRIETQLDVLRRTYPEDEFVLKARELWKRELKALVEEKIVLQAAAKEGIKITDDAVEKQIESEIAKTGSREAYEQMLLQTGQTMEKARERIRNELLARDLIYVRIGLKWKKEPGFVPLHDTFVSPKEMQEYYDNNLKEFYAEEKLKTRWIVIPYSSPAEREKIKRELQSIMRQIEAGADFGLMARCYSKLKPEQDGLWDWHPRNIFAAPIEDALTLLKVGETSEILEKGGAVCVVKVEGRQDGKQKAFEDVQEELKQRVMQRKVSDSFVKVRRELLREAWVWPPELQER
ncbi:MAG: SurA N-terminal domain-containing protein [Planctomycetota bacterium]|nr:SurA N-terminal domain-containing protein [Planctomycetota bacterium]